MAKKLKDHYNKTTAKLIGQRLKEVSANFDIDKFISIVERGVRGKSFMDRQDVFVRSFEECLGQDYAKNIEIFTKILGPKLETENGMFTYGYWLWPVGRYVEKHGTENLFVSTEFIYELTQRFTGEFAIRPLLLSYPKQAKLCLNGAPMKVYTCAAFLQKG